MPKFYRAQFVNSVTGFKPANLIGTISSAGQSNLSIVSSLVHLGSDPAMIGFIVRPPSVERHTYENIVSEGMFTVNHVHETIIERAHQTSARYDRKTSEFTACGLTEQFLGGFTAPFVKESQIKFSAILLEDKKIEQNGTHFLIAEIEDVYLFDGIVDQTGKISVEKAGGICISGLDTYHRTEQVVRLTYAKPDVLPSPIPNDE